MRRILFSLMIIALASSAAVSATRAYFSDTETSTGNTFAAGTLDLKVDDKDGAAVVNVVKDNIKPHMADYTYQDYNKQWMVKNAGTLPGVLTLTVKNVKNLENNCNDPETKMGDTSCDTGNDQGELGKYTWVKFSNNMGSIPFSSPQFKPFNTATNIVVTGPTLQPGDTLPLYMWFDFPKRTDNLENQAQGDSLSFDIELNLTQITP